MSEEHYREFSYPHRIGSHNLLIPVYLPQTLLQFEDRITAILSQGGVTLSDPEFSAEIRRGDLDREATIIRRHTNPYASLEFKTEIMTSLWKDGGYIESYRETAGDAAEERLCVPYTEPLSTQSPQRGIYFSPQDSFGLELRVDTPRDRGIAGADFMDKVNLYLTPRAKYGIATKRTPQNDFERAFFSWISEHVHDTEPLLRSVNTTLEGVALLERIAHAYVHALAASAQA